MSSDSPPSQPLERNMYPSGSATPKGNLYLLVIGVGAYPDEDRRLVFPAKDAQDIAEFFEAQEGILYETVSAKILTDKQASQKAILEAIAWLQKSASRLEDTSILYLSGHGANDHHSDLYYFLPAGFSRRESTLPGDAVSGVHLSALMERACGRRAVILDTCNSGNVLKDGRLAEIKSDKLTTEPPLLTRTLASAQPLLPGTKGKSSGFMAVLASCGAEQTSQEDPSWGNGAFTKALLEGLRGQADDGTGTVTLRMLKSYVGRRVRELTRDVQRPTATQILTESELVLAKAPFKNPLAEKDPLINKTIEGYVIRRKLGEDGRLVIYEAIAAENPEARRAQILTLRSEIAREQEARARLFAAASTFNELKLPGVIETLAVARVIGDLRHLVLQEAATGKSLRDELTARGRLGLESLWLLKGIAKSLWAIHEAGALYLGLNPDTVLLLAQGDIPVKLLFCETARKVRAAEVGQPPPTLSAEKPNAVPRDAHDPVYYFAPELQIDPAHVNDKADVYSLGVMAYHFLTGAYPCTGSTFAQVLEAHRTQVPKPLLSTLTDEQAKEEVPTALVQFIDLMLDKSPSKRPDMANVVSRLESLTTETHPEREGPPPGAPSTSPGHREPETAPLLELNPKPELPELGAGFNPLTLNAGNLQGIGEALISTATSSLDGALEAPSNPEKSATANEKAPTNPTLTLPQIPSPQSSGSGFVNPAPAGHSLSSKRSPKRRALAIVVSGVVLVCGGALCLYGTNTKCPSNVPNCGVSPSPDMRQTGDMRSHEQFDMSAPDMCCVPPPICPPEMVFQKGSQFKIPVTEKEPARDVEPGPFCIDRTEVTNDDFAAWLNQAKVQPPFDGRVNEDKVFLGYLTYPASGIEFSGAAYKPRSGMSHRPVVLVTWDAAAKYCKEVGKELPSQAQWLYTATEGDSARKYPWGSAEPPCDKAVFGRLKKNNGECVGMRPGPEDVGTAAQDRTPSGVLDLFGNVSEWVDTKTGINQVVPHRLVGGNWAIPAKYWRQALDNDGSDARSDRGFRCAKRVIGK